MTILLVSEFVSLVNDVLRETLGGGEAFVVEGEVSGYRVSQGQWVSFDLKDATALVNVFLPIWQLNAPIADGMTVRVTGLPRVYPKYGKFSLSAERIEIVGEGALQKALFALQKRLEIEGLFDATRKRTLPRFPKRIALIASRESAAYGDFIRIINERWGGLTIDSYQVLVQGDRAAGEIMRAIERVNSSDVDAIVITRGGGSFEELMAFNDERVVRAIHGSKIPTLVAIGHERDITLAELAADVRGSTPTDCARRLVPDRKDILFELASMTDRMERALRTEIEQKRIILTRDLGGSVTRWISRLRDRLESAERLLMSLDPERVLFRGYAIVSSGTQTIVRAQVAASKKSLDIRFADGTVHVKPYA